MKMFKEKINCILVSFLIVIFVSLTNQSAIVFNQKTIVEAADYDPNLEAPRYGQLSAVKFSKAYTYEMGGMALDTNGSVWSWGYNLYGSSGVRAYSDGTPLSTTTTNNGYLGGMKRIEYFYENQIDVVDISSAFRSHLALDSNGNVYAWGYGLNGEMGNGTTKSNATPNLVSGLPKIKSIFSSNDVGTASHFALDYDDNIWAWGSGNYGKLGMKAGDKKNPVKLSISGMTSKPVNIVSGTNFTIILDDSGEIWTAGHQLNGLLGNGVTTASVQDEFLKMSKPVGMGKITHISVGMDNTLALDENNKVWQWGEVYGKTNSTGVKDRVSVPREVSVDLKDTDAKFDKNYVPVPQKVFSGRFNYFFIDQYGRVWSWGIGNKYGFGIDSSYNESITMAKTSAVQIPFSFGDGDTKSNANSEKYPMYLSSPDNPSGRYPISAKGVYSSDNLHPTVYDHKYKLRDTEGNYLDEQGNKYKYQLRDDLKNGRKKGFFYKLNTNGELTTEFGVPAIDPNEKMWIGLAEKPLAMASQVSAAFESFLMLDVDGNLYKWGMTGSGTMAWGWDVIDEFDDSGSSNNPKMGLYNSYTYEVMFMRGAPRLPQPTLDISAPIKKIYYDDKDKSEKSKVDLSIKIPPVIDNAQLGVSIDSQLHDLKAIVMPYDSDDPNMNKKTPKKEDVDDALANPNYQLIDVMEKEGWSKPQKNMSETTWRELKSSAEIKENSVIWLVVDYTSYDHNNHLNATIVRKFDNYYKTSKVKQEGINSKDKSQKIYPERDDNIVKLTDDGIKDKYGFPLDKNGKIIGTPDTQPTFGYDKVKVSKLTADQEKEINPYFDKLWWFTKPQTDVKTYTLNGINATNTNDISKNTGELPVGDKFTHQFFYERKEEGFAKIGYYGVNEDGRELGGFNMEDEVVEKGGEFRRKPQVVKDVSGDEMVVVGFLVKDGKALQYPEDFPVDISKLQPLNKDGEAFFDLPFDDLPGTRKNVIFVYKLRPRFAKIHVRQVVQESHSKLSLPRWGYFTLNPAKIIGDKWEYKDERHNLYAYSQTEVDKADYLSYDISLEDRNYFGYGLTSILPQYYDYVGYKISDTTGDYDSQNIQKGKNIKLDYNTKKEYWVTIYIKPTTKNPDNYMWGTKKNDFNKVFFPTAGS